MNKKDITFINEAQIKNKRVLLRADFDVSLNPDFTIADDARIQQNLPTIEYLLKYNNRLICIAKLGRPKERDKKFSLAIVVKRLKEYLPDYKITLVPDFRTASKDVFDNQKPNEILVLENIRFYPEEKKNDPEFAKQLASLGDVFVEDAFSMCHRSEASVVGIPKYIPGYGGLLLKKELEMINKAIRKPRKPFVVIMGGAKISTKIQLLAELMNVADYILLAGGLANMFLLAQGHTIGNSFCEPDYLKEAKHLLNLSKRKNVQLVIPTDAVVTENRDKPKETQVCKVHNIPSDAYIVDIGPETEAEFGWIIDKAKTILWNGPIGYIEQPEFRRGTDFVYYAITNNHQATSVVGGGDTLAAISKKEYLKQITHISTGGGAMLEYIEKGTLPGINALK